MNGKWDKMQSLLPLDMCNKHKGCYSAHRKCNLFEKQFTEPMILSSDSHRVYRVQFQANFPVLKCF